MRVRFCVEPVPTTGRVTRRRYSIRTVATFERAAPFNVAPAAKAAVVVAISIPAKLRPPCTEIVRTLRNSNRKTPDQRTLPRTAADMASKATKNTYLEFAPIAAVVPTAQNTFGAWAPLERTTLLLAAAVRVDPI